MSPQSWYKGTERPKDNEAVFKGSVQGVGFRFTAEHLSRKFQVKGFVENTPLPKADVRLVAEGDEEELSAFLLAIRNSSLKSGIHRTVISQIEQGKFTGSIATMERYLLLLGMQWHVGLLPSGYSQLGDDDGLFDDQG